MKSNSILVFRTRSGICRRTISRFSRADNDPDRGADKNGDAASHLPLHQLFKALLPLQGRLIGQREIDRIRTVKGVVGDDPLLQSIARREDNVLSRGGRPLRLGLAMRSP